MRPAHPDFPMHYWPDAEPEAVAQWLNEVRSRGGEGWVVLEPSGYAATRDRLHSWPKHLEIATGVWVTDIAPSADEPPLPGISAARIAEALGAKCNYVPQFRLLPRVLGAWEAPANVECLVVGRRACELLQKELAGEGKSKRVVVALGGDSAEREVSLHSGRAVVAALESRGHQVAAIDFSELLLSGEGFGELTGPNRPAVVFLALHGTHAEDGAIQGFLELLHLPYTGSDIQTSSMAMDKQLTKALVELAGIRVPRGVRVARGQQLDLGRLPEGKLIVKPNAQGSTVGLRFIDDLAQVAAAVEYALHYDEAVLVEERIMGMEVSVPVLAGQALPVVEIVPASGFYDFESKYTPNATEEICPARLDAATTQRLQDAAVRVHKLLGCRGATRCDFMFDNDGPVFLEINTLPGLTETSLLPRSAQAAGIPFAELCEVILGDV